jgi:hypothetical protein
MKTIHLLASVIVVALSGCQQSETTHQRTALRPAHARSSDLPTLATREDHGHPPFPNAIWAPGQLIFRDQEWVWIPSHWARLSPPPSNDGHGRRVQKGAIWAPGQLVCRNHKLVWIPAHWAWRS